MLNRNAYWIFSVDEKQDLVPFGNYFLIFPIATTIGRKLDSLVFKSESK